MYEIVKAIALGVVQGLTEFLPVSSSGHLEIFKYLFRDASTAEQSLMMTVVLHFATALSTVVIFWPDVKRIVGGLFQFSLNEEFWFSVKILLSMIPAVIVGVKFNEEIESLFQGQLLLVGVMLCLTGVLLLLADRAKRTEKRVGVGHALLIGIAQAIAILPGISRSGATISTSVILGIDREKAARFSFLMAVPLIFGKMGKDVLDAIKDGTSLVDAGELLPLLLGFVAAFLTGLFACRWMIQLVKGAKLSYFAVYCFIVSAIVIAEAYLGVYPGMFEPAAAFHTGG